MKLINDKVKKFETNAMTEIAKVYSEQSEILKKLHREVDDRVDKCKKARLGIAQAVEKKKRGK